VCIRKYKDERAWIEGERTDFERAWARNLITCDKPLAFLAYFQEVDEMAKWVKNAIHTHQVGGFNMTTNPNLDLFSVPPSF
jgi:hypothetical protein